MIVKKKKKVRRADGRKVWKSAGTDRCFQRLQIFIMFRWTHGIVLGAIQKLIQNDKSFPTTQQEDKWTVPTKQQKEGVGIQTKAFVFV